MPERSPYPHALAPPWPLGGGGPYCRHCHQGEDQIPDLAAECRAHKADALNGLMHRADRRRPEPPMLVAQAFLHPPRVDPAACPSLEDALATLPGAPEAELRKIPREVASLLSVEQDPAVVELLTQIRDAAAEELARRGA